LSTQLLTSLGLWLPATIRHLQYYQSSEHSPMP
jgi:hypothetical protein